MRDCKDAIDVKLRWCHSDLNLCQKQAVNNIVKRVQQPIDGRPPYIVFGPPGTGTSGQTSNVAGTRTNTNGLGVLLCSTGS